MTFEWVASGGNCGRCSWIRADGIITDQTPAGFQAFIKTNQGIEYADIVLNSPGGNLDASMGLGRAFREHHIYTEIGASLSASAATLFGHSIANEFFRDNPEFYWLEPGICLSACFFAFVGGERRSLIANHGDEVDHNRLGIHRFSETGPNQSLVAAQAIAGAQAAYLSEMGIDSKILAVAASVAVTSMHDLTSAEAATYRVITENLPPPSWRIGRVGDGLSLNLSGKAENDETLGQFDYTLSLSCRSRSGDATLSVRLAHSRIRDFVKAFDNCQSYAVGFEWKVQGRSYGAFASNCSQEVGYAGESPEIARRVALTLRGGNYVNGALAFDLLLSLEALSILDRVHQIRLVMIPVAHAWSGLPDSIDLPWGQRENVGTLLSRNCIEETLELVCERLRPLRIVGRHCALLLDLSRELAEGEISVLVALS